MKNTAELYDQFFLGFSMHQLKDNLADLEKWAVYNEDKGLQVIAGIKDLVNLLEEIIK